MTNSQYYMLLAGVFAAPVYPDKINLVVAGIYFLISFYVYYKDSK